MGLVYPASLGMLEGFTQVAMKSLMAMLQSCSAISFPWPEHCNSSASWWAFFAAFNVVGVMTIVWLKIVYTRFEVSAALPIEYGTVQMCSYLGGVVFFGEYKVMESWQLAVGFSGLATIMAGVIISAVKRVPRRLTRRVQPS